MIRAGDITIDVIVDNKEHGPGLETWWGLSFLVGGAEKTILFDTGPDGDALLRNMVGLHVDPASIDVVVLSHAHWDHTGGLGSLRAATPQIEVHAPDCGPEPVRICEHVHTTGVMGTAIPEQSLVLETDQGLVVLTGCAHPGIVAIVERARSLFGDRVLAVIGGFHLLRHGRIDEIVERFRALGVRRVGPCHCTGDSAIERFEAEYGPDFIPIGTGVRLEHLPG